MRVNRFVGLWFFLSVVAGLLGMGPSFADDFSALATKSSPPRGYQYLREDANILSGAFESEGARIVFETLRGDRTQGILRRTDPKTPSYEIDIRFLDANGFAFFTQFGGHGPIDASWAESYSEQVPSDAHAQVLFGTAQLALERLTEIRLKKTLRPEYEALVSLMPAMSDMLSVEKTEDPEDFPPIAKSCNWKNRVEIHDAACCWPSVTGARHSATLARNISSTGTTVQVWSTCNHGRCAHEMPMKCSWTSLANRCVLPVGGYPECSTPRNYFTTCGGHVCNDDTLIQYQMVRFAFTPAPNLGTCNDCTLRKESPSCS